MGKILKCTAGLAVVLAATATSFVPAENAAAWGDNAGGRLFYTTASIDKGDLGNTITLNSIYDNSAIGGSEGNFVAARLDDGTALGSANRWNNDSIKVEDGKTYLVRLYVHNNSPYGTDAIAKDVKVNFGVPTEVGRSLTVSGYISSSNATPSQYWDEVTFTADQDFQLVYEEGSALLENNGIGSNGGYRLSDNVILKGGTPIGYYALDGEIPGCYQYASYVSIKVTARYIKKEDPKNTSEVTKMVRKVGESEWKETVKAEVGEEVEFLISYQNKSGHNIKNVMIKDILPDNLKYTEGSTKLITTRYQDGIKPDQDTLTTTGINIGEYANEAGAYITFKAKVINQNLVCGKANQLRNWGQATVDSEIVGEDEASVLTNGAECKKDDPVQPTQPENRPQSIVPTGPTAVIAGTVGTGSIVTALGYYIASRKRI